MTRFSNHYGDTQPIFAVLGEKCNRRRRLDLPRRTGPLIFYMVAILRNFEAASANFSRTALLNVRFVSSNVLSSSFTNALGVVLPVRVMLSIYNQT